MGTLEYQRDHPARPLQTKFRFVYQPVPALAVGTLKSYASRLVPLGLPVRSGPMSSLPRLASLYPVLFLAVPA
jgi:hypothetical protein